MVRAFLIAIFGLSLIQGQVARAVGGAIQVPILMYHYVSELPLHADKTRVGLTITPDKFRAEMQYLSDHNYHVISLDQLYNALVQGAALPSKPIVLTFDDGYIDAYTNVLPILRQFGFTATFFIVTNPVDANNPAYMSWADIQQMAAAGMSIGDHTRTHADLRRDNPAFLQSEIRDSMVDIQTHIGQLPDTFAYPSGHYDAATLKFLSSLPIRLAVTTQHGAVSEKSRLLELPRIRITGRTSLAGYASLLNNP
jgi:peptidoglycan/xylan/chitin deacetylase (PgdA/CDA1 family)